MTPQKGGQDDKTTLTLRHYLAMRYRSHRSGVLIVVWGFSLAFAVEAQATLWIIWAAFAIGTHVEAVLGFNRKLRERVDS